MKIAVIGAGPRGLLMAQSLMNQNPRPEIHLFDPIGIGGQTWRTDQSSELVMNTPAQQIQQFNSSPTLYDWCHQSAKDFIKSQVEIDDELIEDAEAISKNSYSPRRLYGAYLKSMYAEIKDHDQIKFHRSSVTAIQRDSDQLAVTFDEQSELFDDVVITIGNGHNQLNESEQSLSDYAQQHQLDYVPPIVSLNEVDLDKIKPNENVIIRGLGLTFNDVVSQLTQARGGKFYLDEKDVLQYQPSGQEPHIIAGSRRGLPPYPKPISQAGQVAEEQPIFLTIKNIKERSKQGTSHYQAFMQLLRLEIEFRYYSNLVKYRYPNKNLAVFQDEFIKNQAVPSLADFPNDQQLDWQKINNPVAGVRITTIEDYQATVLEWFKEIITDANRGSKDAFLSAGLNSTRALRNTIKRIFNDPEINDAKFSEQFLTKFVGNDAFLTSGAPNFRIEQMAALMRADVLTIIPPQMKVAGGKDSFMTLSMFYPKEIFNAKTLIEARIPSVNMAKTTNPLIHQMYESGLVSTPTLRVDDAEFKLRCANVDDYERVVDKNHQAVSNLYLFGQLTEGKRWLTNICPRTGDDASRNVSQKITNQIMN